MLPTASYAFSQTWKEVYFCHRRRIEKLCRLFYTQQPQMCLYETPGRHPPRITGRFVNTVTRRWVGAPNEHVPFRFHGAVVGFVVRRLSGTWNFAASNQHLAEVVSGRSWPKICPGIIFWGVFDFRFFFPKICAHSERYWNLLAGVFEIRTFFWEHRVSVVTGLSNRELRIFFLALKLARPRLG